MAKTLFQQNFQTFTQWKAGLQRTVQEFHDWLGQQQVESPDAMERIQQALETLRDDRLTIAFVAEFSRGKTELINAIFFSDYGRRLLPSSAGRTTMCPTEMLWDGERNEAYLRLLPIETRTQEDSVASLKKNPKHWVHYPLNTQSPEQMEVTLRELVKVKRVSADEATRLDLYSKEALAEGEAAGGLVEIPRWRHAIISFPHPLLQQGLVIVDTPGLNALGSEPELTLSTLPSAQAVLFVLAADAGVTRTDLEMWQHHVKGTRTGRQRGLAVVLNKIDVLWDELQEEPAIAAAIARQRASTAKILGVAERVVFPVSAQKALLAKVRGNEMLLRRSALEALEAYLAGELLETRQQTILESVETEVGQLIESNRALVAQQLDNIKRQLGELEDLRDKSEDVIQHLLEKTRGEQSQYLQSVSRFQNSREELQREAARLGEIFSLARLDQVIERSHAQMLHSWTTLGMKKDMKILFDELRRAMQALTGHADQTRKMVRGVYQRFQNELGFASVQPRVFSTTRFRVELELLYQEAEGFRKSPMMAVTEQSFVVKRFFQILVGRAREIFVQLNNGLDDWLSQALGPLVAQIQEHKSMMEKRLENLQKIGRSKATLQVRIEDLEQQYAELARQLTALRNLHNSIHISRPLSEPDRPRPRLVSQGGART